MPKAPPKTTDLLTASEIASFTRKLEATVALAEHALRLHQLVGVADLRLGPVAAGPRATGAAGKAAPRRRQPGMATEPVLAALKQSADGYSLSALAAKVGEKNADRVASALRKLRAQKKAVVKGDRALARWFAI